MSLIDVSLDNGEYLAALRRKFAEERVPVAGSIELTKRCNLRCVHCYNGGQQGGGGIGEMKTDRLLALMDELRESGCLYLVFTGGEPLLRSDFEELYRYAKRSGFLISIFTNGTLVDDRVLELLREMPPKRVEVSLYGATAETYERITGVRGAFERCIRGIEGLRRLRLSVNIKTVLLKHNAHEVHEIRRMAGEWGLKFRFDPAVFPRFNGDREPVTLRVPPEEAVAMDFADPERAVLWRQYYLKRRGADASDALYHCGAGQTAFHIDCEGNLMPCLMNNTLKHNLEDGGFLKGWLEVMPSIRGERALEGSACTGCKKRPLCEFCPPFSRLENGFEHRPSEYLCAIGEARYQAIIREAG